MSGETLTAPKVFISYSHDSQEHSERVASLADKLRKDGIDCIIDQYELNPVEGWPRWMEKQIREADYILTICTETYYKRVSGTEEAGKGKGVKWEGNLIYNVLYQDDTLNRKFIPLLFEDGEEKYIPGPLQGFTHYYISTERGYEDLYRYLTNQPRISKPELGKLKELPKKETQQQFFSTTSKIKEKITVRADRGELYSILSSILSQQFNELLFRLDVPASLIPPPQAAQADRTYALLQWAESPTGCGLSELAEVLNNILNP